MKGEEEMKNGYVWMGREVDFCFVLLHLFSVCLLSRTALKKNMLIMHEITDCGNQPYVVSVFPPSNCLIAMGY